MIKQKGQHEQPHPYAAAYGGGAAIAILLLIMAVNGALSEGGAWNWTLVAVWTIFLLFNLRGLYLVWRYDRNGRRR